MTIAQDLAALDGSGLPPFISIVCCDDPTPDLDNDTDALAVLVCRSCGARLAELVQEDEGP